jgi:protein-S-isoprenylcysteine O-methyltransferase Ste14
MIKPGTNEPTFTCQLISPVLAVICLAGMCILDRFYPILPILRFPLNLAGLFIGGIGLAVCWVAHRQFKRVGTTLYPFDEPGQLVTDGLFLYTRNPMYLGLTVFLAGVWILLGTLTPLGLVIAFQQIADRWYVAHEERNLMTIFGKVYANYQAKTPRWI